MGYAKHVGRVGALALALGIGTAVATPAWAEAPSGSESTSSASESPQKPSTRRGAAAEPAGSTNSADDAGTSDSDGDTTPAGGNGDNDNGAEDDGVEDEIDLEDAVEVDPETEDAGDGSALVGEGVEPSDTQDSATTPVAAEPDSSPAAVQSDEKKSSAPEASVDETAASTSPDQDPEPAGTEIADTPAPLSYALAVTEPPVEPAPAPLVRQPRGPIGVILGGPAAMLDIAAKALHMLFNPGPSVPGDPPLLLGVLAFVRREIQRTFFNSSPTAVTDSATTSEGLPTRISVLDNDTDPNIADVLTVTDFTQAANGVVELNADGSFTYTPTTGYSGTDTFTYTISDEASGWHGHVAGLHNGHTSTATVSITVTPAPVNEAPAAADDSATTAEDTPAVIDVKTNDTDPNGDDISIASVGTAQHGTVVILDGTITYTPATNFHGTDTFEYTITDGELTDTATVTVTVTPVNDAPVAVNDAVTVAGNTTNNVIAVLGNDTDPDTADSLTVTVLSAPSTGGTATINADNTIAYTPATGFSGTETFVYTVSDGTATAAGTVTVTVTPVPVVPVNQAPVAANDSYTMAPGATSAIINVVANDTDPDGDTLTVTAVTGALNGTTTFTGTTITYTPTTGHAGTETLTYTVSDGTLTDTAILTINVRAANLAPVFANPPLSEGGLHLDPETGGITGRVIASDPEGEAIEFGIAEPVDAAYAELSIDPITGEFHFLPSDLARVRAAIDPAARTITFTLSASDGLNARTINLLAPITPKHPAGDGILDLADLDTLAQYGALQVSENDSGLIGAIIGTFTDDKVENADDARSVLRKVAELLGVYEEISGAIDVQVVDFGEGSDATSERFYRLTQTFNDVPVLGAEIVLTTAADGTVTGVFSGWDPAVYGVDSTPSQTIDDAQEITTVATDVLLSRLGRSLPAEEAEAFVSSLAFHTNLVIYPAADAQPVLVWQVDVSAPIVLDTEMTNPETPDPVLTIARYYIYANGADAGSLLTEHTLFDNAWSSQTVTADGLTHGGLFNPPVSYTITIETDGGAARMVDAGRRITIYKGTKGHIRGVTRSPVGSGPDWAYDHDTVFTLDNDVVTKGFFGWDPSAVSAMGNMKKVVEFYNSLGWNFSRIPNSRGVQVGLVGELGTAGAHWDPVLLNFAFGSDTEAALDVVAHEFTHAVQYSISPATAGFRGSQGEALAEAYGDILGSLIEGKSGADRWLVGEDAQGDPARDMRNPDSSNLEQYRNALKFDRAAYLMMSHPDTSAVSTAAWAKIFYTSMWRLPSDPTFQNARNAVIASASVQGLTPQQQNVIADAFTAVGITETPRVKIILRWGANPNDLDSHLTGPSSGSGPRFHIYYGARNYFQDGSYTGGAVGNGGRLSANLDYDDTTSYGPETVTIRNLVPGEYYFYVNDYTNRSSTSSNALSRSGAIVTVLKPGQNTSGMEFRTNSSSAGTTWTVFKLTISSGNSVTVTPVNSYSYGEPYNTV